jgi:hypothetical protein
MGKIRIVRGRSEVTKRNAKYYLTKSLPYVSLLISIAALLKAYHVIL